MTGHSDAAAWWGRGGVPGECPECPYERVPGECPGQGRIGWQRSRGAFSKLVLLATSLLVPVLLACSSAAQDEHEPPGIYRFGTASRDGIGKFYLGREISHVMGHRGFGWLERESRVDEEQPGRVVEALGLARDDVVADIGAGSGYFTFRIAPLVPEGKVLAVDIQPEMLAIVDQRVERGSITNVESVLGDIDDPNLPSASVDLVLMVDAYHEFSHPHEMMQAIVRRPHPGRPCRAGRVPGRRSLRANQATPQAVRKTSKEGNARRRPTARANPRHPPYAAHTRLRQTLSRPATDHSIARQETDPDERVRVHADRPIGRRLLPDPGESAIMRPITPSATASGIHDKGRHLYRACSASRGWRGAARGALR